VLLAGQAVVVGLVVVGLVVVGLVVVGLVVAGWAVALQVVAGQAVVEVVDSTVEAVEVDSIGGVVAEVIVPLLLRSILRLSILDLLWSNLWLLPVILRRSILRLAILNRRLLNIRLLLGWRGILNLSIRHLLLLLLLVLGCFFRGYLLHLRRGGRRDILSSMLLRRWNAVHRNSVWMRHGHSRMWRQHSLFNQTLNLHLALAFKF